MDAIRAFLSNDAPTSLALGGLLVGLMFGFVTQRTNFCTMGGISDMLSFGDTRRFRAWLLAAGVAVLGAQALSGAGVVDLTKSIYLGATLDWAGAALGGLLFGFGMVFAGGCAGRNVVRAGSGDLRALVVMIIVAISGYAAIGGLLGPMRAALSTATSINLAGLNLSDQSLGAVLAHLTGLGAANATRLATLIVAAGLFGYCFSSSEFRSSGVHVLSGVLIGLTVILGWAVTGLSFDEMGDSGAVPTSVTYVRPFGDTVEWIERFTARRMPSFGVASVIGAFAGAWIGAKSSGKYKLATFTDPTDTLRNMFGAVLMGVGGVAALGCTLGQGVTGVSTLAIGSFIALAAIVVGGVAGIKTLERIA